MQLLWFVGTAVVEVVEVVLVVVVVVVLLVILVVAIEVVVVVLMLVKAVFGNTHIDSSQAWLYTNADSNYLYISKEEDTVFMEESWERESPSINYIL